MNEEARKTEQNRKSAGKGEKSGSPVNSSLVYKLNVWHLGRLFWSFIAMDILVVFLFGMVFIYQTEKDFSQILSEADETGEYLADASRPHDSYVTAYEHTEPRQPIRWITLVWDKVFDSGPKDRRTVGRVLSDGTLADGRDVAFSDLPAGDSLDTMTQKGLENYEGIYYKIWRPVGEEGAYVTVRTDIGGPLRQLTVIMLVLIALQIFNILTHIGKDSRAIRRKLRPIAELTQTAKTISAAGFTGNAGTRREAEELRSLAGTISAIDVDQLDKRITVDETQKELKDLAAAINDMLDRIDLAYRAQIRFVSDASHELRTPIAVIQGYANLLDRWGKNDEKALFESIDAIKSEADHMKNLIEQLLFLARGDADTMELRKEPVDMSELASEILRETEMIDPNHMFSAELKENVVAFGDEQLIKQAVRIFIDNSMKYTPAGAAISIATRMEQDKAVIVIQDNGIGIPAADVPFVFDRFFRADESRARKTGGAGLGMAIAKWIIDRHDGSVEVVSRQDFGTRITVRLPVVSEGSNGEI